MADGATLESQIEELLDQERFDPPQAFAEQALVTDESVVRVGRRRTTRASGPSRPRSSTGSRSGTRCSTGRTRRTPSGSSGGKLNVAYNCLDRHVEAGNGDRVAFHWRGEEGEELDVTYADLHRDVQKFANALKDNGIGKGDVVGIFLPMIPEVAVAMLACARIGAIHNVVFGGFSAESVKERMEFSEAKALVTVDGARRKGKTAAIKESGRRGHGRREVDREDLRRQARGQRRADDRRPRHLVRRGAARRPPTSARPSRWTPSTRSTSSTRRARRPSRRASCTRPAAT